MSLAYTVNGPWWDGQQLIMRTSPVVTRALARGMIHFDNVQGAAKTGPRGIFSANYADVSTPQLGLRPVSLIR